MSYFCHIDKSELKKEIQKAFDFIDNCSFARALLLKFNREKDTL